MTTYRKILIPILAVLALAAVIGSAKAPVTVSIEVKDSGGNIINDQTVHINTIAFVYGHYEDPDGAPASATIKVYFNDGSGFNYRATLFEGIINSGDTVVGQPYAMSELGQYEFRWTCTKLTSGSTCQERAQARTRIQLSVPEPATIAGIAMAFSALGLVVLRRKALNK